VGDGVGAGGDGAQAVFFVVRVRNSTRDRCCYEHVAVGVVGGILVGRQDASPTDVRVCVHAVGGIVGGEAVVKGGSSVSCGIVVVGVGGAGEMCMSILFYANNKHWQTN
jgi:hypothetical protein